ncbi:MAG: hypothetical protein HLX50_22690 [Alteromonadaceae bacterium]|nr:hypothetical protein [Alteromonadaceae bacterium]
MAMAIPKVAREAETTSPAVRRNRKDVLGLADTCGVQHPSLSRTLQKLSRAGFHVSRATPEHWIIRRGTPLPEYHCYSEQELHQFTANRT